jgi:uncharacterized protein YndB with AHSA1/START domain
MTLPPLDGRTFEIVREFAAPRDLVWTAWTKPEHVAQWWGPKGWDIPVCEMDVRPGGAWRLHMRDMSDPTGAEGPIKGTFGEIVKPERLVMILDMSEQSDEWHDLVNPGWDRAKGHPAMNMEQTTFFEDLGGNRTRLTIRIRVESDELMDRMKGLGMNEGWSQTLDKMADTLSVIKSR